ncbi:hypothetical protein ACW2QC_09225 [Virgibacillus sp. FSP13]
MNYETATKEQLLQVALNEDCPLEDKYKACRQLQIKFTISKYRKQAINNDFDASLSSYWRSVYYGLFKKW